MPIPCKSLPRVWETIYIYLIYIWAISSTALTLFPSSSYLIIYLSIDLLGNCPCKGNPILQESKSTQLQYRKGAVYSKVNKGILELSKLQIGIVPIYLAILLSSLFLDFHLPIHYLLFCYCSIYLSIYRMLYWKERTQRPIPIDDRVYR